jgi:hypothetical protein
MSDSEKVEKSKNGGRRVGSGRVKGIPNKATQDLFELCKQEGVDVFQGLLRLCKSPTEAVSLKAHCEAAKYLYPQRKAIEMNATHTMTDPVQVEMLKEQLRKANEQGE